MFTCLKTGVFIYFGIFFTCPRETSLFKLQNLRFWHIQNSHDDWLWAIALAVYACKEEDSEHILLMTNEDFERDEKRLYVIYGKGFGISVVR